jgi:hypothetical protein
MVQLAELSVSGIMNEVVRDGALEIFQIKSSTNKVCKGFWGAEDEVAGTSGIDIA